MPVKRFLTLLKNIQNLLIKNPLKEYQMSVSNKDLDKIANLARLNLSEASREKYTGQLNQILEYVKKLDEVDTSGIEPLVHSHDQLNVMRDDIPCPSLTVDDALKNAPKKDEHFFRVPKVVSR